MSDDSPRMTDSARSGHNDHDEVEDMFGQEFNVSISPPPAAPAPAPRPAGFVPNASAFALDPGGLDGDVMKVWETVPREDTDFRGMRENLQEGEDPNWCFMCYCTKLDKHAMRDKSFGTIVTLMQNFRGQMSPMEMTQRAQKYYNNFLRPYTKLKRAWTRQSIWNHVTKHAPTTNTMLQHQRDVYWELLMLLDQNAIFEREQQSGQRGINYKAVDYFIKVEKQLNGVNSRIKDTF